MSKNITGYYSCDDFVRPIYDQTYNHTDLSNEYTKTLCSNYNMTNPGRIKFYINATWYENSTYTEKFLNQTGWNEKQMQDFFDVSNPDSFGSAISE